MTPTDREQERAAVVAGICLLLAGCQGQQACVDGKHYMEQGQQGTYVATGNDCVAIERLDHLADRPAP